jgi:hypothetical protein
VVLFLVLSGGDKADKDVATAPTVEQKKTVEAPPPVKRDPNNPDDFVAMPVADQRDHLMSRTAAVQTDLLQAKELLAWLANPKVAGNVEAQAARSRVVESALKIDANCEWAHEARGDKRIAPALEAVKSECKQAFVMQNPEEKLVLERLEKAEKEPWASTAEWTKYEAVLAKIRAREAEMKSDPRYLEAERKKNWVRENPMFKEYEITWKFSDPYVIFQQVKKQDVRDTKRVNHVDTGYVTEDPVDGTVNPAKQKQNEEWAKKGELFTKRDATMFAELDRNFRSLFAERFKLPTLKEKSRILTALVMWNRHDFDKLLAEAGQTVGPGVRAFYSPPQQKIFHYIGDDSIQGLDELQCDGGHIQKMSDQVLFHEGTHQLQHEYSAIFQGSPLKDDDKNVADRKAMWFEEGLAEFMGAVEIEADKVEYLEGVKWFHNRILLDRIHEARRSRDDVDKWTIKEFLKPNHNGDLLSLGEKLSPGQGPAMASHFYCRAWAFCHFLWFYDSGKYREKFLTYLEAVLKGTQSSDKFAKIMGRPNVNDWGPIEKEYEWYWQKCTSRKVGKSKVTGQWETPKTEAPTGKVEDDADFCEIWDENHKDAKKKDK